MESLEQGREPRAASPRRRLAVGATLVALVAAGTLGWALDTRWRTAATADLALAFDESVTAIEIAERRVQSVMEYTRPARERFDVDPDVRASLDALVRETAADAEGDIAVQRDQLDAISLPPWHADLREARERARTWLDLRAAGITSVVQTGRATYPPREELDEARASLRDAWTGLRAN